jgi:NADH pyrophosphatase NudC (nudix superfamily)
LPGGGLEVGESFIDGVTREVGEEMGVKVTKVSPLPKYLWTLVDNHKPKLILVFEVEVDSFNFQYDPIECVDTGFFTKQEMATMNLHPNIRQLPKMMTD